MKPFRSLFCLLLCGALLAVAGCEAQTPTADVSRTSGGSSLIPSVSSERAASAASDGSSEEATGSSGGVSSETISSAAPVQASDYFDVDAAFAASGKKMTDDVSSCFPESAKAYQINGGTASQPYLVDAATLKRLTVVPVKGSGFVRWVNYGVRNSFSGPTAGHTGVVPVARLHDPVFTEMALPTEAEYWYADLNAGVAWGRNNPTSGYNNRKNGFNMVQPRAGHENIINMGAVFLNYEVDPPAKDASITLCLKDFKMYVHKKGDPATKWITMSNNKVLADHQVGNKVAISWAGGNNNVRAKYKDFSDRGELALKGGDLWTADDYKTTAGHQYLIHFWDTQVTFSSKGLSPEQVDGVVCSYVAWVKEPEMSGKLLATVGADLRPGLWPEYYSDYLEVQAGTLTKKPYKRNGTRSDPGASVAPKGGSNYTQVNQCIASRAVMLTSTPRVIFCHNVYPDIYDKVVDTDTVQKLIGLN